MLNSIIRFSIQNKLIVAIFLVALIALGIYSIKRLPVDAVPDITNNQVQVLTVAPSQSALDIERLITFPVEQTMATIQGIQEVRSFSRFGLSVVTLVFSDDTDVYWARQQVNERLIEAKRQIPPGVGTPQLAPITTGLGEIYQYMIAIAPGYEDRYDIMDLRSIQDWLIRRQLLGTPGVAEVSSFGGFVKQYEIALDPEKLHSLDLSIQDVFAAIEKNNENTGGAYIEKNANAYFIRSEGLIQSIEDINSVVVRNDDAGYPLLIRDIATVKLGSAIRYGAMTQNGKSETVGAVVMMLKGANSSQVVINVKKRIAEIEKTLPEGLTIEPFLDRTKLVDNAIHTVTRNLIEGALIVVFVLVLLLGDLRAGLVVASVIPFSMLFAVSMMNLFGVSGNLMSLGAIDFGLIVDGAVIIVEATLLHIASTGGSSTLNQVQMDEEVTVSATKMMKAAAFGQIIILIVYLPVLSLVGIEGKMFRPMAQTVIFAITGAFILSLTYVPLASALFLSKKRTHKANISDRFVGRIRRWYEPVVAWSLRHKFTVTAISVLLFVLSILIFNTLGGEFLPELDEGDFAVDTRVLTGSSLSTTIAATLKGEKVLMDNFPEVEKVVGKIGSSEIPTDPMPIDAADLMVVMKPKSEWVSAETKDEMISKMQGILEEHVPGVWFGFQHPIQMRFNELMTGARQDVVVKVYGEDLDKLTGYASEIGTIVSRIAGTESLYKEPVTGLPQIVIHVKRDALARFGLTVRQVNEVVNTGLAGQPAGLLFEGEKRFDIVVRMDVQNRQSLEDIRNLYITARNGLQVPLLQVATVGLEVGPAQIQRDDAKRRIVVGFNTRGRDVESIVGELREKIEGKIKFDPGYFVTYGGDFKNLQEARSRLAVAVPVALILIFILLYFTFGSVKQGLLIYTAIPLSAIGGIVALWLRDMPFSISAGVGFIALFGVAVLNGIVLIAEFNRLKKDGLTDLNDIIMKGTSLRLRPVLMTAMVASLGFLPMALSHGSGAEVQKPLATVVIGGLISATLLTLVVLPALYLIVETFSRKRGKTKVITLLVCGAMILPNIDSRAQEGSLTLDEAIRLARAQNPSIQSAALESQRRTALKATSIDIPNTTVMLMHGQYNSVEKGDNNFTVSQRIPFPTVFVKSNSLHKEMIREADLLEVSAINELTFQVKQTFNQILYRKARQEILLKQDSLFADLSHAAAVQFKTGEGTLLAKTMAEMQRAAVQNEVADNEAYIAIAATHLQSLCGVPFPVRITGDLASFGNDFAMDTAGYAFSPALQLAEQRVALKIQEKKLEAARVLPDLYFGYINQSLIGTQSVNGQELYFGAGKRFQALEVGLSLPLWGAPHAARVRAAELSVRTARKLKENNQLMVTQQYREAVQESIKNKRSLDYYRSSALAAADFLVKQSRNAFENGELDYTTLLQNLRQALGIEEGYLTALQNYNQSIIRLEYLSGNDAAKSP